MFFASGDSYFAGVLLIAWAWRRSVKALRPTSALAPRWNLPLLILGALFIVAASTPPSLLMNALLTATVAPLLVAQFLNPSKLGRRFRVAFQVGLAAFVIIAGSIGVDELRVAMTSWPEGLGNGLPVYVVGDSLSAADTEPKITAWPERLRQSGVNVTNLALVGATARSALKQVQQIPEEPCLILILIGGNDVLGPTSSVEFDRDLAALLQAAQRPERTLAVCELPLPPLAYAFGSALRRRTSEAGAILIPKRTLSRVFSRSGNTVDGIHLSQAGQDELARLLAERIPPLRSSARFRKDDALASGRFDHRTAAASDTFRHADAPRLPIALRPSPRR